MAQQVTTICDHCGSSKAKRYISAVNITFGGNGAAKDGIFVDDLCDTCYAEVVQAIKNATSTYTPEK